MIENTGRATRTTVFIAIIVGFLMLGLPSIQFGGQEVDLSLVDDAAAAPGDRTLRIGYVALMDTLQTLNPFVYTWGTEGIMIWTCYSTLLTHDVNQNVIGDLALEWDSTPDGLQWHVKIVNNAKFYNRLETNGGNHPLTAADVIYTFMTFQETTPNNLQYFFPQMPGQTERLIESMWSVGDYDIYFKLRGQYAPFLIALATIPILPSYIWSQYNPLTFDTYDMGNGIPPLVGSGPYYYGLDDESPTTGAVELRESPTWFAREQYGYDVKPSLILFKDETDPTAQAHFLDYSNDFWVSPNGDQYVPLADTSSVDKFHSSQGYVWEFNMNQLSLADRDLYGIGGPQDYNNQLLLDPTVKLALQMSIDKSYIADEILEGLASPSDSLIPSVSPWHYVYGSEPGDVPIPFDPAGARALLNAAGWTYNTAGVSNPSATPLCKQGGSDPLSFRYITPNTDPKYHDASLRIDEWAAQAGVDLVYTGASTSAYMNGAWYSADYDTWLWNWWFGPSDDPSADVMQVLTTEAIGSWSDVYWSDPTYDALYYESLSTMTFDGRKALLDEMQRMAYEDSGCWPAVNVDNLYAAQTVPAAYGDRWTNWGNWTNYYTLCPDSSGPAYPWLWIQMYPLDNVAPQISGFTTDYEGDVVSPVRFTGSVVGETSVEFRWNFGDGTYSPWTTWSSGAYVDHQYAEDGIYKAYFMVRESSGLDAFMSSAKASVTIIDDSNTPPRNLVISTEPLGPDEGTLVYINGTAIDDQLDPMTFSWNFGDGTTGFGQQVTHQFTQGLPSYTITMYVDDGHLSQLPRPVSTTKLLGVGPNQPPTISVQDETAADKDGWWFTITASDSNPRDRLRFTWDWGDGDPVSVTTTQTAYHVYKFVRTFTLTVYADDLTGLSGHNVSDTGLINSVRTGANHVPKITLFTVTNQFPLTGEVVTFTGTGTDDDGDLLMYTWNFGDGNTATDVQSVSNTTLTVTHAYMDDGIYQAYLSVYDGTQSKLSSALDMIVDPATFGLSLVVGWNFVSVPLINTGYMANNLGLAFMDVVCGWNPMTATYDRNYYVGVSPIGSNFPIEEGEGYWIYSGTARTLPLTGDVRSSVLTRDVDVRIGGGWAIISTCTLTPGMMASDIPPMFSIEGGVTLVAAYNPVTGLYKSYYPIAPSTDFALTTGEALWVWITASGTFSLTP
ncbi:MAG TPA: PKD domain-containing protein [Thermoplasmata archaeon]